MMISRLTQAFVESDDLRRTKRVTRSIWISQNCVKPTGVIVGRTETQQLLNEAEYTFIDGHFVATLLLAMAFIEHTIVEDLQLCGLTSGSPAFAQALRLSEQNTRFPPDWLRRAKRLSLVRNPFSHLKEDGHEHALSTRYFSGKVHPQAIMENDAKDAIELMFNFHVATP